MEFRRAAPGEYERVRDFLSRMGWKHRVGNADRFRRLLEHTDRHVIAVESDEIVGFGRALCDGVSNGYISMVAVAPDRQREGIGREIVRRLMGDDPHMTWVLRSRPDVDDFWQRLGFAPSHVAMERLRETSGESP